MKRRSGEGMEPALRVESVLGRLRSMGDPSALAGMASFGIRTERALGVPVPAIRKLAREIGRDHGMAQKLWESGLHEARMLAAFIDDPALVTAEQMERWVLDFDSWDVCDQVCGSLFDKTSLAYPKAVEWTGREEEFVRRAGFVLMATLAVHDKKAPDERFLDFLPLLAKGATDERNFVKKAVNWALRQIGKRSWELNRASLRTAKEIARLDSRGARWIASDAIRELESEPVQRRLQSKKRAALQAR